MSIDRFFQTLEHGFFHISQRLWPPDLALAWRDEAERIRADIERHAQDLEREREDARILREKVFKAEVHATILGSQIESWVFTGNQSKAWREALELDQLRENLHHNRKRLAKLENHCRTLVKVLQQQESRLILLQLKLAESAKSRLPF